MTERKTYLQSVTGRDQFGRQAGLDPVILGNPPIGGYIPIAEIPHADHLVNLKSSAKKAIDDSKALRGANVVEASSDASLVGHRVDQLEQTPNKERQRLIDSVAELTLKLAEDPPLAHEYDHPEKGTEQRAKATKEFTIFEEFFGDKVHIEKVPFPEDPNNTYAILVYTHQPTNNDLSNIIYAFGGNHIDGVSPVLPVSRQGNILYGRSVADMNGPNAVIAHIILELAIRAQESTETPPALAIFTSDEEIGSPRWEKTVGKILQERGLNPDIVVSLDGAPENTIETAAKGLHTFELTIDLPEGVKHSAHGAYSSSNVAAIGAKTTARITEEIGHPINDGDTTIEPTVGEYGDGVRSTPGRVKLVFDVRTINEDELTTIPARLDEIVNEELQKEIDRLQSKLENSPTSRYTDAILSTLVGLRREIARFKIRTLNKISPMIHRHTLAVKKLLESFTKSGIHLTEQVAKGVNELRLYGELETFKGDTAVIGFPGTHEIHGNDESFDLSQILEVHNALIELFTTTQ